MGFVFSPSNLGTYKLCPRRFQGQSITKEIKWKASSQKSRGTLVHNSIEQAVRKGFDSVKGWPEGVDVDFLRNRFAQLSTITKAIPTKVLIEQELCITRKGRQADWWDDDTWLRAKADMVVLPENPELPVSIVDFKTGKRYDTDHFQLRTEAYLVHQIFGRKRIAYSYWYVDSGELDSDQLDFSAGLYPVQDILNLIEECQQAINSNYFMPSKNKFCKWCDFYKTTLCGL